VAQTLAREDFQKRLAEEAPIGLHELVYPVMQGWDSVQVKADVEFGGTDQLFNLLVGRDLQVQCGQAPQAVVTTPLVNGLDGRKMSKSYGNTIGLTDPPKEVFGKAMSLSDDAMAVWFELLTRLGEAERAALLAGHPRTAKVRLALELVELLHGAEAARAACAEFERQFVAKELPSDIPLVAWPVPAAPTTGLQSLLVLLHLASSGSEARRLIQEGGVKIDQAVVKDPSAQVLGDREHLIQVGKRRFVRLVPPRA
jgi:tyrosyl-tRNA synthetase